MYYIEYIYMCIWYTVRYEHFLSKTPKPCLKPVGEEGLSESK